MVGWIRRHYLIATAFSFFVGFAPQWIASVWSLFSSEPLVPWIARHKLPQLAFSPWLITAPAGLIMFLVVIFVHKCPRKAATLSSSAPRAKDYSYAGAIARLRSGPPPSAELVALKQKLANLLAKADRIKSTPNSVGFDMDEARSRNQRFIEEVRGKIERLESEEGK